MSLRAKLGRLSFGPAPSAPPAPSPADRGAQLEALRARMDAIVGAAPSPTPRPRVDVDDLPFAVERTAAGPLHVRTLRVPGSHRVGRVPVVPSRGASSELLALLALDPALAGVDLTRALYLDTETTGLGPGAGTVAFLVGLAFWDVDGREGGGFVVEQLLVRELGEEAPVLARVAERIRAASCLVTFNGKSFDIPVLRTRFVMQRADWPAEPSHLDLLHVARRLHKARGISCNLTGIEREVLGFCREDDVPSGEVSACYLHFLRTGDASALLGVVEHNTWDVITMAALVGLYGEPLEGSQLEPDDLVGVARTLRRAGELDAARAAAEAAVGGGGGPESLRARAEIAKARGDRGAALSDYEAFAAQVDDPRARLELAKLYEHYMRAPGRALAVLEAGTSEPEAATVKRRRRLEGKLHKRGPQLF
ncbi:MAG: ribonuclease H-like domain-containing protein [Polyangiaceae bacterium]